MLGNTVSVVAVCKQEVDLVFKVTSPIHSVRHLDKELTTYCVAGIGMFFPPMYSFIKICCSTVRDVFKPYSTIFLHAPNNIKT